MGKIEKILKKGPVEGQTTEVYPVTSTKAVYDENNKRLDNIITGLQESVYLNTPIPISTDNTPESMAQNVKNISDYIEKAKAAGIADVNGMAVTCLIDDDYSGIGYIYRYGGNLICGIQCYDDVSSLFLFSIRPDGNYIENEVIIKGESNQVTSNMLVKGARKPIILTPDTTEVDEETYQKLLSDDVDVLYKMAYGNLCTLTYVSKQGNYMALYFTCFSVEGSTDGDSYLFAYEVDITNTSPHTCSITENISIDLHSFINSSGYLTNEDLKSIFCPILQEIDLTGTDADRKAKLDKFETDWKALTGASDLSGARFIGNVPNLDNSGNSSVLFINQSNLNHYVGCAMVSDVSNSVLRYTLSRQYGSLTITPLFSHLEAITISIDNTPESKAANVAAIEAYEDNLEALGFDMTKGYMIPITASGRNGFLSTRSGNYPYAGYVAAGSSVSDFYNILILGNGEYYDSKIQSENSSELNTISKKLVPAINEVNTLVKNKQDKLTSGTNIKTINNQSLLGSGNIEISAPSITVDTAMSDTSTNPVQNKVIKAYIDGLVGNVATQLAQI